VNSLLLFLDLLAVLLGLWAALAIFLRTFVVLYWASTEDHMRILWALKNGSKEDPLSVAIRNLGRACALAILVGLWVVARGAA
jgi:hypothetical protein